jgi:hypothetical protein
MTPPPQPGEPGEFSNIMAAAAAMLGPSAVASYIASLSPTGKAQAAAQAAMGADFLSNPIGKVLAPQIAERIVNAGGGSALRADSIAKALGIPVGKSLGQNIAEEIVKRLRPLRPMPTDTPPPSQVPPRRLPTP